MSVENKLSSGKIIANLSQEDGKIQYDVVDLQLSDGQGYNEIWNWLLNLVDSVDNIKKRVIDCKISGRLRTLSCSYYPD